MRNRGQTMGIAIVSAIFIFIVGFLVINFLMGEITSFRADMQCANPAAISDSTKLLCLATDATVPYWIVLMFSILVGAITSRLNL
jgi:hypothetical protein